MTGVIIAVSVLGVGVAVGMYVWLLHITRWK